jgi:nifR3 family TIM-barrel protein
MDAVTLRTETEDTSPGQNFCIGNVDVGCGTVLAPLAGVTNRPFRLLCREQGAGLAVTEMVSAKGMAEGHERSSQFLDFDADEHPISVQVFGSDPDLMAEGARAISERNPDLIDVNCGCPVRKIVNRNAGAALLRDPKLLGRIVRGMVRAVDVPVTVKIRSGWDDDVSEDLARVVEDAGAAAIAVHGRTRQAKFGGDVDWESILKVKRSVSIPVIGNGDVRGPLEAKQMMDRTGCDMVMVGRWAIGNPWIFHRIGRYLESGVLESEPDSGTVMVMAIRHLRSSIAHKGLPTGLWEMRRHLAAYLKRVTGGAPFRRQVMTEEDPEALEALLRHIAALAGSGDREEEAV